MSQWGGEVEVINKLNLTLGLTTWPLRNEGKRSRAILSEPDGAQRYRRNILALSGVVAVAGLAGGHLHDFSVFGMKFSTSIRGVLVLGGALTFQPDR